MEAHGDVCKVFSIKPSPFLRNANGTPARFARIPSRNDLMSLHRDTGIPKSLHRIAAWTKAPGLPPAHVPRGHTHEDAGPLHLRYAGGNTRSTLVDTLSTYSTHLPCERGHHRCDSPTMASPVHACVSPALAANRHSSRAPLIPPSPFASS